MAEKRFGTFEGVFTPCLLSILGVIMYLRLGWVVGSVGLGATLIIIALSNVITLATALSMSSVITNIRIGAGGAYSIISKSLGIEAGGAIGIPLYISQAISVAFYIAGFSECWHYIYPHHDVQLVSIVAWFVMLVISYVSARLAFRIQYVIMALILLSIVSVLMGRIDVSWSTTLVTSAPPAKFWMAFAIFFPAVTGVLAGATMSGELVDPKRNIPIGTLAAIIVSLIVYTIIACWFSAKVPKADLVNNMYSIINYSRWSWLVVAGIMGATVSSALSMFVGSPRVLRALSNHSIVPFSKSFSRINKSGEPVTAILFTSLIALITIIFGSLDQIAELLTMFFLITYGMINLTVFIEQSIGIVSFRPTFRIPRIISFIGSVGCLAVMFLINAKFSLIAFLVICAMYYVLIKRGVQVYSPDIRSGILVFMAEQFAKVANRLPYFPKIWKPNLFIPTDNLDKLSQSLPLAKAITAPAGRLTIFNIIDAKKSAEIYAIENNQPEADGRIIDPKQKIQDRLEEITKPLREEGVFVESAVVEADKELSGAITVMQAARGMFFPPNTLFYILDQESKEDHVAAGLIEKASDEGLGVIVLNYHPKLGLLKEEIINLWIRRQSPNMDLSILITLQIEKNWEGKVRLIQVVDHENEVVDAKAYLNKLKDLMRIPVGVEVIVLVGNFKEAIQEAPSADLNIFGMQQKPNIPFIRDVSNTVKTSVLFLRDSEHESALA